MTKLFLVRHGQTEFNRLQRYQGQIDNPLNEAGFAQAAALGQRLKDFQFQAVYSSDLLRARQTSEAILKNHPGISRPILVPELREINGGKFEGLKWEEILEKFPGEARLWQEDRLKYGPPGGENLAEVVERVKFFLGQLQIEQPGEESQVLVVTHGGILGVLLCHLLGMDLNRIWQWRNDPCSLTLLGLYPAGAIVSLVNDTAHLNQI